MSTTPQLQAGQNSTGQTLVTPKAPPAKKLALGLILTGLLGLAAAAFIIANIYQGMFILRAPDAMVTGSSVEIRSFINGVVTSQLAEDVTTVQAGQVIATLAIPGSETPMEISSPCNCLVLNRHAPNGTFIAAGESLMSLVPTDAKSWVIAELDPEKTGRIKPNTTATITVAGSEVQYTGKIVSITSGMTQRNQAMGQAGSAKPVQIKIMPNQSIPADFINRPAHVSFSIR